jgi:hypothetical protein
MRNHRASPAALQERIAPLLDAEVDAREAAAYLVMPQRGPSRHRLTTTLPSTVAAAGMLGYNHPAINVMQLQGTRIMSTSTTWPPKNRRSIGERRVQDRRQHNTLANIERRRNPDRRQAGDRREHDLYAPVNQLCLQLDEVPIWDSYSRLGLIEGFLRDFWPRKSKEWVTRMARRLESIYFGAKRADGPKEICLAILRALSSKTARHRRLFLRQTQINVEACERANPDEHCADHTAT